MDLGGDARQAKRRAPAFAQAAGSDHTVNEDVGPCAWEQVSEIGEGGENRAKLESMDLRGTRLKGGLCC